MYCLMTMTTKKPGTMGCFAVATLTSYELKLITGESRTELAERYVAQARAWLEEHPDREILELSDERIRMALRYGSGMLERDEAEEEFTDLVEQDIRPETAEGTSCIIHSCWAPEFWELRMEIREQIEFPANPGDFDSNAIESAEAWDMLEGEQSDCENYWNRQEWKLKWNIEADEPGFVEAFNKDLWRIAHEPKLEEPLNYFEGCY